MASERSLRLTNEGKVIAFLVAGFALGALNTGTNLIYLLWGLLLNLYLLNLWVSRRTLSRVEVERRGPSQAEQGVPCDVHVSLAARRGMSFPVCVGERLGDESLVVEDPRIGFHELPPGTPRQARAPLTFRRRGRHELPGLRLTCRAPFGLVESARNIEQPWTILVVPAQRPLRDGLLRSHARAADALARRWLGMTQERRDVVRSLRDHRPGDDRRAIHWRSSARRGALVVKEFERTAPNQSLVILDLAAPAGEDGHEAVEAAVTLAASLIGNLARRGERYAIGVAGEGTRRLMRLGAGNASLNQGLRALAVIQPTPTPDLSSVTRQASLLLAESRVFLVTTRAAALRTSAHAGLLSRAQVFDVSSAAKAELCFAEASP